MKKLLASAGLLMLLATGCADPVAEAPKGSDASAISFDSSAGQSHISSAKVDSIAAAVPAAVRESGKLVVGSGSAGGGQPPLAFTADDNKTPVGVEIDIAYLVASVLGLQVEVQTTSWENLFLGLDSGKYQVGISNIGVSELRKEKYDFATYRLGLHAWEAKKGAGYKVDKPADIAGKTVAVSSGTLQEAILLDWNKQNVAAGLKPASPKYFQTATDYYLALESGRIDLYLGPNPVSTYHVATSGKTEIIGTVSSGYPIQGLVGVTTKKDAGLAKPIADALNAAIKDGSYAKVLAKWHLEAEAVPASLVNPPGLPKTKQK
jgi:polar amino acid transport system substrate-binding protein